MKINLLAELSRKMRIPETILNHTSKPYTCSVAQHFSWAATRIVSDGEEVSSSFLGYIVVSSCGTLIVERYSPAHLSSAR